MNKTNIEYLDYTWNPIAMRCTQVSEGCVNCWHLALAERLRGNPMISEAEREAYAGHEAPMVRWKELKAPITTKKSGRIGVQFMGDLFCAGVGFDQIHQVFDVMWQAQHHTFVVLTKRPGRMFDFMAQKGIKGMYGNEWPLRNLWLGVTAENQARADERIPILLQIPAAVRFVSVEPMLGPVDLRHIHYDGMVEIDSLTGDHGMVRPLQGRSEGKMSWVICGGESGPGARPMHPEWVRSLRDQCQAAAVPFMFKQWGEWSQTDAVPGGDLGGDMRRDLVRIVKPFGDNDGHFRKGDVLMRRVGKKAAGRLLDGQVWDQYPEVKA